MNRYYPVIMMLLAMAGGLSAWGENDEQVMADFQDSRNSSLQSMIEPMIAASDELEKLRKELRQAASQDAKDGLQVRIDAERERIKMLRQNFRDIIGGAEAAEYDGIDSKSLTLQAQVSELVQPVLSEMRKASSGPRELESLRNSLDKWLERQRRANVILARIANMQSENKNPRMTVEFESARKYWEGKIAECVGQIGVIRAQIHEREMKRRPLWESLSDMFSRFFRSRGLNLILAILTGILSYVFARRFYVYARKLSPVHRGSKNTFTTRITDIVAMLMSVIIAVWGVLLVLYVRGDWLLLTVSVLLLIGMAWAGKQSLPPYLDQIRMMLNLGSVREGERVIYLGLPWEVRSIGFFTLLKNPNLQGGELRIPIRHMMSMISRDSDPKEPWFPTEVDDWVIMPDGLYGKVVTQTPEQVVLLQLGGSLKTYPCAEFLAKLPENLSRGFRLSVVFGIDYTHQRIATSEVPGIIDLALTNALVGKYGREAIRSIKVEFNSAAASSLDYQINVDVEGSLASRYQVVQRSIQKVCVETCNEQSWLIPFTQITVHQAGSKP